MIRLYSPRRVERLLRENAALIDASARRCGVPGAALRAILYKELTEIDLLDVFADLAVGFYWLRYDLRKAPPRLTRGVLGKKDSSTGWAQIFAYVALRALREAKAQGLTVPDAPDGSAPEDLGRVWRRLRRDRAFNLDCCALNLRACALEMTGRCTLDGMGEPELKRVFTRYNADTDRVTAYGEAAYQHYLRYLSE